MSDGSSEAYGAYLMLGLPALDYDGIEFWDTPVGALLLRIACAKLHRWSESPNDFRQPVRSATPNAD